MTLCRKVQFMTCCVLVMSVVLPVRAVAGPLVDASKNGDLNEVRRLLENGTDPNADDDSKLTALNWAAYFGHLDVVKALVEAGATVDANGNSKRWTPLMNAANKGHAAVGVYLMSRGADLNLESTDGFTPLGYALLSGQDETAQVLRTRATSGVHYARGDIVLFMNKSAAAVTVSIDGRQVCSLKSGDRCWPALGSGDADFKHAVHAQMAARTWDDRVAISECHGNWNGIKIYTLTDTNVRFECKLGSPAESRAATVLAQRSEGTSILESAKSGDIGGVKQLLANRVDPNAQDADGLTALNHAAYFGHLAIVKELVEHGANVNANTNAGRATPLMNAAYKGHADVVQYLLDHGANPRLRDKDGNSASEYATAGGHASLAESLLPQEVRERHVREANCRRESETRRGQRVALTGTIRIRYDGLANNPVDVPISLADPTGWWCQGLIHEVPIRAISGDRVCRQKSPATVSGKLLILPKPAACRPDRFDPIECPFPELPNLVIEDAHVTCR